MSTFRIAILLAVSFGLIVIGIVGLPTQSRAKVQEPQQTTSTSTKKARRQSFVPGEILVRYRSESMAKGRTGAMRITAQDGQLRSLRVDEFEGSKLVPGLRIARLTDGGDTMSAVAALRLQADVVYAEPNYILKADVTPNDPRFGQQPNMNTIGAPTVWNTQTGSNTIVVGVIDQGIDINHADLQANIWTNPAPGAVGGGITGDVHGYNFVDNNGTVFSGTDAETHASHVAGIIGAVGNNSRGVVGVNWSVGLMSLKFLDANGFGDTANAIRACTYAQQMHHLWVTSNHTQGANLRVLNASFGGAEFSTGFSDAIQALNTEGILFVAAAGNVDDGTREPNNDLVPHYPSNFNSPNIIAVGATNSSEVLAGFSHFGATTVHLGAPGVSILSTTPPCANPGGNTGCLPDFTDPNGDTYSIFSGTSMAAPHVSGAAALLLAQNPNLTVPQLKALLILNGDVQPALIDKTLTGRRLNVANSFQALLENDTVAPGAVTNMRIDSQSGRTFNLRWTASGDDGATGQASLYEVSYNDPVAMTTTPLTGVIPMPSGSGQIASVTVPYRHPSGSLSLQEFDNAGNAGTSVTVPISVPQSSADPYTTATGTAQPLTTGGSDLNVHADDQYVDVLFPSGFRFPFFGQLFDTVTISTNGIMYFGGNPPTRANGDADDVPSSPGKLGGYPAIAGLWDDLDLRTSRRADAGIFQIVSPGKVIFRWQGVPCAFDGNACTGTVPVNFEIELNSNGVIKTRYGTGNTGLFPTVGIAGGEHDPYVIGDHTSEETPLDLTNAPEVTFTPRADTVSTIQFTQATFSANENVGSMIVNVSRSGDTSSVATVDYASSDTAGTSPCTTIGTAASSRCDYLTTIGTLRFAAGETSKQIGIPIINDVFTENAESFTLTLSNPTGATLGAPTTATLTINDGGAEGGANPIDTPDFFVRQHYVDFLNREPDAGGLAFWTGNITSCGANAQCIEVKRINVSGAFFLSIEFQETGYLVYRIYKTAFGNLPNAPVPVVFTNFLRDTQQIGQGVQVNVGDWQNQLEANKQAFTLAYVQRPEFLAAYPNTMTAAQIVDQMNTNAGNVLSASERTNLINLLGATPDDLSRRAAVLRAIAEDPDLKTAEFNKAFVLMQYFGYLRRSPNDFPDSDFSGLNFWLGKLNQFSGDFVAAEMVKAFLSSTEYRQRFAP